MSLVQPEEVAIDLGRALAGTTEAAQIQRWINTVERRITHRLGSLHHLDTEAVRGVVVEVVARRARNPEGKQNERIDDYSYGLSDTSAKPDLWPTEAEWAELTPAPVYDVPFSGSVAYQRGW